MELSLELSTVKYKRELSPLLGYHLRAVSVCVTVVPNRHSLANSLYYSLSNLGFSGAIDWHVYTSRELVFAESCEVLKYVILEDQLHRHGKPVISWEIPE